ncbi:MAG: glycosyltransferase [Candidatus Babeliales bacterium]
MTKKITVLHVTNNYYPYRSGVARSLDSIHNAVKNLGHSSYLVTLDFKKTEEDQEGVHRLFCPFKFSYKQKPMAIPLRPFKELSALIKALKPSIIHVHHPFFLGKIALDLGKRYKIPVVFTYHTQYEQYVHYIPLPEKVTQVVVKKLVEDFCNDVDALIAPSKTIADELSTKHNHKTIQVIPSGIDSSFYQNILKTKVQKTVRLLTVSRFAPEKNIEFLLRVARLMHNEPITFHIVGYGPHEQKLFSYAYTQLGLSTQKVRFIVKPSTQDLVQEYQQADLFLFASTTETQGIVLAEAMAAGLPVIALDAAGSRDIIKHGSNGFLIKTEQEMVDSIKAFIDDNNLYAACSQESLATAQQYTPEIIGKNMLNFYYELLKSR